MRPLVGYVVADAGMALAYRPVGQLYDYVMAGNGLFIRAEREGLSAQVCVAPGEVRGLCKLAAWFHMEAPRVPAKALSQMLSVARDARRGNQPVEALFHLWWDDPYWSMECPPQEQGPGHVIPTETGAGSSYEKALIEVHSHHAMQSFWSTTDDKDEQGFRLYGVLGTIFGRPQFRLRVGVYGHFMEIPAQDVFDLPEELEEYAWN